MNSILVIMLILQFSGFKLNKFKSRLGNYVAVRLSFIPIMYDNKKDCIILKEFVMEKDTDPEELYNSLKSGLGKFYKQAKDDAHSSEALLNKQIESIRELRTESRRYVRPKIHAEGGMKMIISATDRLTRRQIAIAKMKENKLTRDSMKLFLHEARVLARLDHPNIVPLHDIGIDSGGEPYFTMKLLSGESLGAILLRLERNDSDYLKKYTDSVLLDIFLKVCDAVAFAHSRNIVHRDLKPDNIQVSDYGEVLLCDWGLAKDINLPAESTEEIHLTEVLSRKTNHGMIKGTPGFMAPEQVGDDIGAITERTDIYALGCILYSLVTFRCPFRGDSLENMMEDIKKGKNIPLSKCGRSTPKALEAVINKAMSANPDQRYKSVNALAGEVRDYLDGFATKAQKADFGTHLLLLIKRHKAMSTSLAISFIIIVSLVAFFLIELKERESVALKALSKAEQQKIEMDNLSKVAAPEFLKKAESHMNDYQFGEAYESVKLSKNLNDSLTEALYLLGSLQLAKGEFFEAAVNLSKIKDNNKAVKLLNVAVDFDKKRYYDPTDLAKGIAKAGDEKLLTAFIHFYNSLNPLHKQKDLVNKLYSVFSNNPDSPRPKFPDDKSLQFSEGETWQIKHLSFFKGMELQRIDISNSDITDLRGLIGMPVKKLIISGSKASTLHYLKKLPIEDLDCSNTQISDLRVLLDMPLKRLNISNCPIRNYNILDSLKELTNLTVSENQINKIPQQSLEERGVNVEISPN